MAEVGRDRSLTECVLDLRSSSRGDLIATSSALVAFPLAFWGRGYLPASVPPDVLASVTLLAVSVAVASLLAGRADWSVVPAAVRLPCATRWGARIGAIVFLIGGGAFLLGTMARQVLPNGGDRFGTGILSAGLVGLAFSLMPTVAAGSIACLFRLRPTAIERAPAPATVAPPAAKGRKTLPLATVFFALSVLSLGIPPYLQELRTREERRQAEEARQLNERIALEEARHHRVPELPPEPVVASFQYEPPAGFVEAPAASLTLAATREVPGLGSGAVAAYSPDSRFLAFTEGGGRVTVFDTRKAQVARRFEPLERVSAIAWSPRGNRIFCLGKEHACAILDTESGAIVRLPVRQPLGDWAALWESEGEIGFSDGGRRTAQLDLSTLRVAPAKVSEIPPDDGAPERASGTLAETKRAVLGIRPRVTSLQSPAESASARWHFGWEVAVFATDKESGRHFPLHVPSLGSRISFLASPDATTITVISPGEASIHYLGISDGKETGLSASEPPAFPKIEEDSPLAGLTGSGRVAAFVCAPLVNPLDGKVVGADGSRVRALAFLGGGAEMTVAETYFPIQPGDVAGYLHYWQSRAPVLLSGHGIQDWWSPVSVNDTADSKGTPREGRWQEPRTEPTTAGLALTGWGALESPQTTSVDFLNKRKELPARRATPPTDDGTEMVRAFVLAHHEKAGRGDLDGFARDYAPSVDFHDKGIVTAEFVRQDQAAYLPKFDGISETVLGEISVARAGSGWRASYGIRSYAVRRADGRQFDRQVAIVLDLVPSGDGSLRIVRERAGAEN